MFCYFWNILGELQNKKQSIEAMAVHYDGPGIQGQGVWSLTCNEFHGRCAIQTINLGFQDQASFATEWNSQLVNHNNSPNKLISFVQSGNKITS